MPREIEDIQQEIVKNVSLSGLQLPSNLKSPFLDFALKSVKKGLHRNGNLQVGDNVRKHF